MSSAKTVFQLAKQSGIYEGELLVAFALGFANGEKVRTSCLPKFYRLTGRVMENMRVLKQKRESASSMAKLTQRKPMGKQELKDMFTKVLVCSKPQIIDRKTFFSYE